jgi:hypothetical protein
MKRAVAGDPSIVKTIEKKNKGMKWEGRSSTMENHD